MKTRLTVTLLAIWLSLSAQAVDYPYEPYNAGEMDPQKTGWPPTAEERAWVLKAEHDRRPGRESSKHLPALWPVVPSAGFWGGTSWLDTHEKLVDYVRANPGPCDVLLVGDSITQQWGSPLDTGVLNAAWQKHFASYRTINLGIGGDKSQNVLWRLDHGGVEGLQPKVVVVMIGNNNMFFVPETGVEAAAKGVQMCVTNLRGKFPDAEIIAAKILPCHAPGVDFYENIRKTNAAIEMLKLASDPKVHVLDLWGDFTNADGSIRKPLFWTDSIHLSLDGYAVYASRLKPLLDQFLGGKGLGGKVNLPAKRTSAGLPVPPAASVPTDTSVPDAVSDAVLKPTERTADGKALVYPYAPYNLGRMDPQLVGWPLTAAETEWVTRGEFLRKPGHEVQKHLPDMWFVTPTAGHWPAKDGSTGNDWLKHHGTSIGKVKAAGRVDIALIGDSITQGWGGGWDGAPFNPAWQKHFGEQQTVNLGIGGDRREHILWRLDHGALDGASPKVIVLMIGVNNANGVQANGVPVAAAAHGIKLCIENLRLRCPQSKIVLVKLLPAFDPGKDVGRQVVRINALLDALKVDADPNVRVLDLWKDFTNPEGTLKTELYADKHLHLGPEGYAVYASRLHEVLQPLLEKAGR